MILIEARRLAIEMSITDFAGNFMRRNGLCMRTKTTIAQKLPHEYERKIIEFHKYEGCFFFQPPMGYKKKTN